MKEPCRVLVIDDNPDIHELFRAVLAAVAERPPLPGESAEVPQFQVECADRGEEGLARVARARVTGQPYTLAFVDLRMGSGWSGVDTIGELWKADPALEVVLCTAFVDCSPLELGRQLRRTDQLLLLKKPFDDVVVQQMALALAAKWRLRRETESYSNNLEAIVTARTQELERSIAQIRASENQYRLLFDSNPTPIFSFDLQTLAFIAVNQAAVRHYGYSKEEFLRLTLRDIALPEELPAFADRLKNLRPGAGNSGVWRHRTRQGKLIQMEITSHPLNHPVFLSLAMDVTERLNLEAQLRQSQKMESVGQLAGGIAHDFNNLLTVINGHAGLLLASESLSARGTESVKEIAEAGKRASGLTRQLLTFSRKQELHPQAIDLNDVVQQMAKMLRRVLGEDITLRVDFSPGLPNILADITMIEQVILNLAVNSRDAMPHGGQLEIKTSLASLNDTQVRENPEAVAGNFVHLSFTDTGEGIPPEVLGRIFEPFFTTKPLNRGTGLGLATVYGIVKQHRGWITVRSELGTGTVFDIYLPVCSAQAAAAQWTPSERPVLGGTETVLVVEDEAPLLKLMRHILESHGYKVLDCLNARDALAIWEQHRRRIDLLLTDLILPDGMAGPELARLLREAKPELKILFTSGYDADRLAKEFPPGTKINCLPKPFHAHRLAEMVQQTLHPPAQ